MASPSEGAPALKYGDVNTETTSPDEVKGLMEKDGMEMVKNIIVNIKLILEGTHLNGERHREGKEYNKDGLIFEREYLYGEKHGKGKKIS